MEETFSVYQWFEDGSREDVLKRVPMEQAVKLAISLTRSIGARFGTTKRVIITRWLGLHLLRVGVR